MVLKTITIEFSDALAIIIQNSTGSGRAPMDWRAANATTLVEEGEKNWELMTS